MSLVLVALAAPAVAAAQQPSQAQMQEARTLFERGIQLIDEERWGEALEYLRRSRAIVERPSTVFNIAAALLRLGRPTEGIEALQAFLRIVDRNAEAQRYAEAQQMLTTAQGSVVRLTLTVSPAHARVRVDGTDREGEGPTREILLDPGRRAVEATAPGFDSRTLTVEALPGARETRSITLQAAARAPGATVGRLVISSNVAGAEIIIDGREVGTGRASVDLRPGRHRMEVRAPGYVTLRQVVNAEAGDVANLEAVLERERPGQGSVLTSPIFWTIVGGAVAIGAGVTIGVVALSGESDPYEGSTGVVLEALRRR
ncbi:MAG: PEGA domain-containing protein [Deltaproteobacteria bacterium]|nr:PEGA domain-containing protein [Deltaproteobacteria bacterium]